LFIFYLDTEEEAQAAPVEVQVVVRVVVQAQKVQGYQNELNHFKFYEINFII